MPAAVTSPTLLLALAELGRTDGKELLKSAVKELVSRDVLRVDAVEQARRLRRPRRRFVLFDGPAGAPPTGVLAWVAQAVAGAPAEVADGRVGRDLGDVAKHLAKQPRARKRVVELALAELAEAGLVVAEERRALGVVRRSVHVRTPAGDAALDGEGSRRQRREPAADADSGGAKPPVVGGEGGEGGLDGAYDGGFDSAFDSSFDSSFDSAFDSGFSGGDGGGGGGGDGGGGS